jgi:hypothetical protein
MNRMLVVGSPKCRLHGSPVIFNGSVNVLGANTSQCSVSLPLSEIVEWLVVAFGAGPMKQTNPLATPAELGVPVSRAPHVSGLVDAEDPVPIVPWSLAVAGATPVSPAVGLWRSVSQPTTVRATAKGNTMKNERTDLRI